jgi:hypothetical protein
MNHKHIHTHECTRTTPHKIYSFVFLTVLFCGHIAFGFNGLYVTSVCICGQLEKPRLNHLDIRQKPDTFEEDSGAETDREEEDSQV